MLSRKFHKRRRSILALSLSTIMLISCAPTADPGASGETSSNAGGQAMDAEIVEFNPGGTYPICKEKVTLTIGIPDNIRIEDYETNWLTQQLEERGNFDLVFEIYPSSEYATKLNLIIQSGTDKLPDILVTNSVDETMITTWAQAGAIIPVTEYYKDPNASWHISKAIEKCGVDITRQMTQPDGEIYALPSYVQNAANEYFQRLWIYEPWLEELEMEVPATTEEFRELLRAVVSSDLNGNGKADEIGLLGVPVGAGAYEGWFTYLMNSFIYISGNSQFYVDETDGSFKAAYMQEEYKEGLKYIRSLFEEGLIPEVTLTQDSNSFNTMVNSADTSVFSMVYSAPDAIATTHEAYGKYIAVLPLEGPDGVRYMHYNPANAITGMVITSSCKNPEAAFRLGDLMCSEELSIAQRWGAHGVDWDYVTDIEDFDPELYSPQVAGAEMLFVPYDDDNFWGGTAVNNGSWRNQGATIRPAYIAHGRTGSAESNTEYYEHFKESIALYYESGLQNPNHVGRINLSAEESELIAEQKVLLDDYVASMTSQFLAGVLDIDDQWDTYLQEIEKLGVTKIIEVYKDAYERMYGAE